MPPRPPSHPTPDAAVRDPDRLAALARAGLLLGEPAAVFDRLTALAAAVLRVPVALVSIVDADRQHFVGCLGLPEPWATRRETPLSHSFCQHVVESGEALVITDAREHPLVWDNLAIRDLGVVAYAGMPLAASGGEVLGSFCIIDTKPREWTDAELEILRRLADSAVTEIEMRTRERSSAETAARLAAAMDGADLGAWSYDVRSRTRWNSARASEMFGTGAAEAQITRDEWLARVHDDDRERMRALIDELGVRGDRYGAEYRLVTPAGDVRWVSAAGRVLRAPDGAVELVVGTIQDVSERARLEAGQRETAERLRTFVEAVPVFAWLNRADGSVEQFNRRWYEYTGQDDGHREGTRWLEAVHPEDLDRVRGRRDRALATTAPYEVELRLRGADGGYRWIAARVEPVRTADGPPTAWVGAALDIDDRRRLEGELRESEARFRTLQDVSPDGSALLTAVRDDEGAVVDFVVSYVNGAATRILTDGSERLVGRTIREAFPESVADGRLDAYRRVVETGETWRYDVNYRRGPVRRGLGVSAVKVEDGVHLAFADVTDRIRAAAERERLLAERAELLAAERVARSEAEAARAAAEVARAAADAANRSKSDFLAVMSHELRTPLNAIGGYAELIELGIRGPVTPEQRADLERIQRAQRHLLGLINGVLNYAKVDAGAVHYEVAEVPLDEVLATCEALVTPQARAKSIALHHEPCDRTLRVRADREKVQQVVLNLLNNAVKFTDAGGRASLGCAAGDDGTVSLWVSDTGRGIAPGQLERVFQPFVQVDATLTRTQEGTGLGLAISRDLARGMGGDLTATSVPGVGSTFTLTLPRA